MTPFRTFVLIALAAALAACTVPGAQNAPPDGARRFMSPAPHAFRASLAAEAEPVRRGAQAERFELRDGDCGGSDCGNPRARAEIELDPERHPVTIGQDTWYGWSFRNASVPAFTQDNALRLVFGQWTVGGRVDPVFRFIQLGAGEHEMDGCDPAVCRLPDVQGDLAVQLVDVASVGDWGAARNDGYVCRLFDMAGSRGLWRDIVVNTNFSPGPDGYLRIWVDRQQVCDYRGPVVSAASLTADRAIRHRRGIFSSWTKRWEESQGGAPRPTLVVYYDEFRTGRRASEVDLSQLEAAGVAPLD